MIRHHHPTDDNNGSHDVRDVGIVSLNDSEEFKAEVARELSLSRSRSRSPHPTHTPSTHYPSYTSPSASAPPTPTPPTPSTTSKFNLLGKTASFLGFGKKSPPTPTPTPSMGILGGSGKEEQSGKTPSVLTSSPFSSSNHFSDFYHLIFISFKTQ